MEKEKHLGLRIDAETHKKLKSLAEFEGRSVVWNGQILFGQEVALYFQRHIVVLTTLDQTV